MPINGVYRTVLSKVDDKGKAKMSTVVSALSNGNEEAKKSDPKDTKKKK